MNSELDKIYGDAINRFITSLKSNVNIDELIFMWNKNSIIKVTQKVSTKDVVKDITTVDIKSTTVKDMFKYTSKELQALCKSKGYVTSGKKQFLIDQLLGIIEPKYSRGPPKGDIGGIKVTKKKLNHVIEKTLTTIEKLKQGTVKFKVSLNEYNNYQHVDSNLVIDMKNKMVVGSQQGKHVLSLSLEEIDICRKYNLKFNIPQTFSIPSEPASDVEHLTNDDYAGIEDGDSDNED